MSPPPGGRRARLTIRLATGVLLVASAACVSDRAPEPPEVDAISAYCARIDIAGAALGELQREFKTAKGDPRAPAHNIATVFADQVDTASGDLDLQDEWAVVVSNQVDTQLWRVHAGRLEKDVKDTESLIALSSLIGHAQGACDTWSNIKGIHEER